VLGAFAALLFFPNWSAPRRILLAGFLLALALRVVRAVQTGKPVAALLRLPFAYAWLAAFTIVAALSLTWSVNPALSVIEIERELGFALLALTAYYGTNRPARTLVAVACWCAATITLQAVFTTYAWLTLEQPLPPLSFIWSVLPRRIQPAGVGVFSTQLLFASILMMAALALNWRVKFLHGVTRDLHRFFLVTMVVGLLTSMALALLTDNRVYWVALAFSACALAWGATANIATTTLNAKQRVAVLSIIAIVCLVLFTLSTHQKWQSIYGGGVGQVTHLLPKDERLLLWPAALELIAAKPVLGYGYGQGIARELLQAKIGRDFYHAHNLLLNASLQLGIVGIALMLALVTLVARRAAQAIYQPYQPVTCRIAGYALIAWLASLIIKNATDDFFFRDAGLFAWLTLALLLALTKATPETALSSETTQAK
jgi:hypothetical protein